MKTSESIAKIAPAFLKAQKEMGTVTKNAKSGNANFSFTYANLEAVLEACKPALNANGISVLQLVGADSVETVLMHESAEWISTDSKIVVAKLGDPQANGSGITYIKRYALLAILGLPTEDDDAESAMGKAVKSAPTPTQKPATPRPAPQPVEDNSPTLKQKDAIALILRHNVGLDASGIKTKADASKFISEHGQGRTYASYVS